MCPTPDQIETNKEDMVPVDLSTAVKSNGTDRHGDKKGFYARPSDFLSNTSNWKVSNFRGSAPPRGATFRPTFRPVTRFESTFCACFAPCLRTLARRI